MAGFSNDPGVAADRADASRGAPDGRAPGEAVGTPAAAVRSSDVAWPTNLDAEARLRELASALLAKERVDHTLQTTALLHELWLRMAAARTLRFESERAMQAWAAEAMRCILVDHARRRNAQKRGAGVARADVDAVNPPAPGTEDEVDFEALDAALRELEAADPRGARVVVLRYFGRMSVEQVAECLGVSQRTVGTDFALARGWLRGRLQGVL